MKLLKKVIIGCALFLLCASALFYWYHKVFPYGDRTCCLPCMMSALRLYAADHGDWYPKGGRTSLESLQLLYSEANDYTGEVGLLAGISGNVKETERRIKAGLQIDEQVSSWTYFPGFRDDDDDKMAIIWERQGGIRFNGSSADGHAVGFADGHHKQIPQEHWGEFLKQQEALRQTTLAKRKIE
jgi:hypothetical protein